MQEEQQPTAPKGSTQFHIAEYTALRADRLSNVKSSYDAVTYVSIANAGIFSWLVGATSSETNYALRIAVAWLPLFLTIGGWALFLNRNAAIRRFGAYFSLVENALSFDGLGWERFVRNNKRGYLRTRHLFHIIFFANLILSVSLGILITNHTGLRSPK
jgi:hypothetical protein